MTFLAGASIFAAAFLLFALEPLMAKQILPWFGGSAAVWSVCLVFYQVALLAGYAYASALTKYFRPIWQITIHLVLLAVSIALLPIGPSARWKPGTEANPAWMILEMLTVTIGLPFAVLAATSPLLQAWLARSGDEKPYRFFAWSNLASLSALLLYPLAAEPYLDAQQQSFWWSAGFVAFVILCGMYGWLSRKQQPSNRGELIEPISPWTKMLWLALAACGSMLLLSITNHIDENVAAVPLLWVLPLAVYLISFIVAFGAGGFYRREFWLRLLACGLALLAYAAYDINTVTPIQISVPIFLIGLFIGCVFCQGELYRLRPEKSRLTEFYVILAAGGAAGAVFVGLIAPRIFGGIYELPLSLTLTAALALTVTWREGGWGARILWLGVSACMAAVFVLNWQAYNNEALALRRSFYGSLRVVQSRLGTEQVRTLFHGTIEHGDEFMAPARRMEPTTYYGQNSGIGIILREWPAGPKRVGVVGLGAGTLAAYGEVGDSFRFYEINPQVIDLASRFFYFLSGSKAKVEMVEGDGRLSLEREQIEPFDVLVLDAFSGDAIPVHLLTSEAMDLYVRRLRPGGVMAFHVSNNYLDLTPVIQGLADHIGYRCVTVKNSLEGDSMVLASEWVLVSKNDQLFESDVIKMHAVASSGRSNIRLWTDSYNSLLPLLKPLRIETR